MTTAPPVKKDPTKSLVKTPPLASQILGGCNVMACLKDKFVYWGEKNWWVDPRDHLIASRDRFARRDKDNDAFCWRYEETGEPVDFMCLDDITGRTEETMGYKERRQRRGELPHCGRQVYHDVENWRFVSTGLRLTEEEARHVRPREKVKGKPE